MWVWTEFFTASVIACGSALQAIFGKKLIKHFIREQSKFRTLQNLILFMILGGGIACITNALMSSSALLVANVITLDGFLSHSFSWWVGDVFGVIIIAPVFIILLSNENTDQIFAFKRKAAVIVPMCVSLIVTTLLFSFTKTELKKRSYQEYQSRTNQVAANFVKDIELNIGYLSAVSAFFKASEYVSADEFHIFTKPLLSKSSGLYGLSWIKKITHTQRNEFVSTIRKQGFENYQITIRSEDSELVKAPKSDFYFPITYVEPYQPNKLAHGFDVYAYDGMYGNIRKDILHTARDTGLPQTTRRFAIVQKEDEYGFIVYYPVYSQSNVTTVLERQEAHIGYIGGIFVLPKLVKKLEKEAKTIKSSFVLEELSGKTTKLLYDSRTANNKEGNKDSYTYSTLTFAASKFNISGQTWRLTFIQNEPLLSQNYVETLWVYILSAIMFNVFLLVVLTTITARNSFIEQLVDQRTKELKHTNEELEEFTYRTSHDLRSPLVSSIRLLELSDNYIKDNDKEQAHKAINLATGSLKKLEALIDDILSLAKTKNVKVNIKQVDVSSTIQKALQQIEHMDNYENIKIIQNFEFDTDLITEETRFKVIIENLLSNAVKYYDPEKTEPFIKIHTERKENNLHLTIEDNGLGVPVEKQSELFTMFKRFHPKTSFGSGLGLYMVQKSASILGGDIIFKDTGEGSSFALVIPTELKAL